MMTAIIVIVSLVALAGSVIITKKSHNPVEEIASEVIEKETGVDVDKLLPKDK